jgi:signal transduction histidine kinase
MSLKIYQKVGLGFGSVLFVSVIVGCFAYNNILTQYEANKWRNHTHEVIKNIQLVESFLKDAETGQRGFLLTRKNSYLEPYELGLENVYGVIQALEGLTVDNNKQQIRIKKIKDLVDEKFKELTETIRLFVHNDESAALEIVLSDQGKDIMDNIRKELSFMTEEEERLLTIRTNKAIKSANNTKRTIFFGTIFSIFIIFVVGFVMSKSITNPINVLIKSIELLKKGKYPTGGAVFNNDEIGLLAQSFDEMANSLESKDNLLSDEKKKLIDQNKKLAASQTAMVNVLEDLTETKKELEELTFDLKRSNQDLEQFAYVASHDLQEPLRMVASFTQLLEKRYSEKLDEKANEYINYAVSGSKRMQKLIDDLLQFSRIGRKVAEFEDIDLNELVEEIKEDFQLKIKEKNAKIKYEILPLIKADRSQIKHVFQNFISNAIKFCEENPVICIDSKENDQEWEFQISDNGIGIEKKYLEKIFIIFQRLNTRKEYEGTGIGLALCKKLIENYGGRISVESEKDKGTTFKFTLKKGN